MQKPFIHLNGDLPDTLAEAYFNAMQSAQFAFDALCITYPNARNFYPIGPDAYNAAITEHAARLSKLQEVVEELSELAAHCFDAAAR